MRDKTSLSLFLRYCGVEFSSITRSNALTSWWQSVVALQSALDSVQLNGSQPDCDVIYSKVQDFQQWCDGFNMSSTRATAALKVDSQAETERLKYVTPGEGQAMVYLQKQAEAERYVAAGSPADLTGYPLLAARAVATGMSAADVAAEWLARASAWASIAAQIETVRETAKSAVAIATTEAEISAIVSGLVWPS